MASGYHQLGMVAQDRGRLAQAERWYRKSLDIAEDLGNRPGMASGYHQLGMVAQDRGLLEDAERWYRKSLDIKEDLGNRPGMANSYGQLGLLAEARRRPQLALEWIIRCVTVFDEFPHPLTGPGPSHLARLTTQLGEDVLEKSWMDVTGQRVPDRVWAYVRAQPEDPGEE
jgi:tetratricopeptide (TPR) repeat protein